MKDHNSSSPTHVKEEMLTTCKGKFIKHQVVKVARPNTKGIFDVYFLFKPQEVTCKANKVFCNT
jgi:hypothetical protein